MLKPVHPLLHHVHYIFVFVVKSVIHVVSVNCCEVYANVINILELLNI